MAAPVKRQIQAQSSRLNISSERLIKKKQEKKTTLKPGSLGTPKKAGLLNSEI